MGWRPPCAEGSTAAHASEGEAQVCESRPPAKMPSQAHRPVCGALHASVPIVACAPQSMHGLNLKAPLTAQQRSQHPPDAGQPLLVPGFATGLQKSSAKPFANAASSPDQSFSSSCSQCHKRYGAPPAYIPAAHLPHTGPIAVRSRHPGDWDHNRSDHVPQARPDQITHTHTTHVTHTTHTYGIVGGHGHLSMPPTHYHAQSAPWFGGSPFATPCCQ